MARILFFLLVLLGAGRMAAAQTAPPAPRATIEDVRVAATRHPPSGGGLIRRQDADKAVSTVSQAFIATQAPAANAYQYLQLVPGALVQNSDPFGLSQQFAIDVHGLGPDEIGVTLEGMPINDIGYYDAYPSQAIDSENIDEVSLAPGTADLDSPVIGEAGGLIRITMLDPSLHPGGLVDASVGSFDTDRAFVQLDTGLIGASGLRAFVSYSDTGSDDWRGAGRVKRQHVDFKLVREWGDGNRIAWSGEWHDAVTPAYQNVTLAGFHAAGANAPLNNYATFFTPGGSDFWGDYDQTFRVFYTSVPSAFTLTDALVLNVTPYAQYGFGNDPYETVLDGGEVYQGAAGPFTAAVPNAGATGGSVMANALDRQYRAGLVAKLTWTRNNNTVVLGDWFDYANEADIGSYSGLSASGVPADLWGDETGQMLRVASGPFAGRVLLDDADAVITRTDEIFAADILRLLGDRLTLEAGLKYAWVDRRGTSGVPAAVYSASAADDLPLPRIGARWRIDATQEVFASAATDFRTPSELTLIDQYSGGVPTNTANASLRPEISISEVLGYRWQGARLTGTVSLFNYNFTNRQIATLGGPGGLENLSVNAGGQTSRGVDVEAGARPWHGWSPYVSGEFLHATIDNDIENGADFAPTAGKTATSSPEFEAALGLHYDDGTFFGQADVKYVGRQWTTFTNDESIPSHATPDLSVGVRLPEVGLASRTELQLNLVNIGGPFLSGVATPTVNAHPVVGRFGTVIAGSEPTYFLQSGTAVLFTAKQAF